MGLCGSGLNDEALIEGKKIDKTLTKFVDNRQVEERKVIKVLLLGSGESGKSTVYKQMQLLYGSGIDPETQQEFRRNLTINIIDTFRDVYRVVEFSPDLKIDLDEQAMSFREELEEIKLMNEFGGSEKEVNWIANAWSNPSLNAVFSNQELRSNFQIPDNLEYFITEYGKFVNPEFEITDKDLLLMRVRTTGIHRGRFDIGGTKMEIVDVGGQRNERRKWFHQFEGVATVIFVTALNDFCKLCFEDGKTNRMNESLDLFSDIGKNQYLEHATIVLFLNKRDLFDVVYATSREKMKEAFSDFTGDFDGDEALKFIEFKFRERISSKRDLFVHVTTATDSRAMEVVIQAVKTSIANSLIAVL